jgi:AAA+ superfamily predicted ATPase
MIENYLKAGFPILAINTSEPERAQEELSKVVENLGFSYFTWTPISGIKPKSSITPDKDSPPMDVIKYLNGASGKTVLFVWGFHFFIKQPQVIQGLLAGRDIWKADSRTLIILSPEFQIPTELDKSITVLDFMLPTKEQLKGAMENIKSVDVDGYDEDKVLDAATGLTLFEAENAFALSLVEEKTFSPTVITRIKSQMVKKSSSLEYGSFDVTFDDIGGLDNLKDFCSSVAKSPLSKGVLLLGPPGTGKSMFSKALGNELGLPTLALDFGKLFGSLVGQSEQMARDALATVDAMAPCILFIDEIEKGLSGMASSGQTDGGTGARVGGTFLKWANDHKSQVFVIATSNDYSKLPSEFLRAERWDAMFFIDLPSAEERKKILDIYKKMYDITGECDTSDWTGAEISSVCRIAKMMNVSLKEAAKYITPIVQFDDRVSRLREWAKDRTIPASKQISLHGRNVSLN